MNRTGLMLAAVASLVALAACDNGSEIDAKNASVEEVQKQVAQSEVRPRPGRWEQSVKVESMDIPNMPAEAKAEMAKMMNMTHTAHTCLTPEQAAKPDASFFQQAAQGCTYDHFTMGRGRIDAKMTCTQGPQQQVSTMKGTYGPENYDLRVEMQSQMMGRPVNTRVALKMKRVGECTGKEES